MEATRLWRGQPRSHNCITSGTTPAGVKPVSGIASSLPMLSMGPNLGPNVAAISPLEPTGRFALPGGSPTATGYIKR